MDLRSGKTIWQLKDGDAPAYPRLEENVWCDTAIVGGGISGALIAHELAKAGFDCIMVDRREPAAGSTVASTSLLLYELDTMLCDLSVLIGETEAAACYKACRAAVRKIHDVVAELGDPCDFTPRKSFYLAETDEDAAALEREWKIRTKHGLRVDLLDKEEIARRFSFERPAALLSHDAAEIDVLQFTRALIMTARTRGLRAYGSTTIASQHCSDNKVTLMTESGHRITAGRVIFATGYESEKYLGRKIGALKSTYAIATKPLDDFPGWHERSLIWTTARPYLYLRTTADNRVVIGGGDIDFQNDGLRDSLLPAKTTILEKHLRSLFPAMEFELACAWAGTFGETKDSLARIGAPKDRPNTCFALGYGGNGITYSMIAAEIIREACLGRSHPWAPLFRLDRD